MALSPDPLPHPRPNGDDATDSTSLWLDAATDAAATDAAILSWIDAGIVTGVGPRLQPARVPMPAALRALAARLVPAHRASGGCDGLVQCPLPPDVGDGRQDVAAVGRWVRQLTGSANVLIDLPFDAAGLAGAEALVVAGVSVAVGPVFSAEEYAVVAGRYQAALTQRLQTDESLADLVALTWTPVGAVNSYAGAAVAANGERDDPIAEVGEAVAQLIYAERFKTFAGPDWRRLHRAGAWPLRGAFCDLTGRRQDEYLAKLTLPGAILSVEAQTLHELGPAAAFPPTEPDETEAQWVLREVQRRGLDLRSMSRALGRRFASRRRMVWR
jgi:hypothetical protein